MTTEDDQINTTYVKIGDKNYVSFGMHRGYNRERKEKYAFPCIFFSNKQYLTEAEKKKNNDVGKYVPF